MNISRKDVEHIARLARIGLDDKELGAFERELSSILGFVAKLNAADTGGVEPLSGGHDLDGIMREDDHLLARNTDAGRDLIDQAPAKRDGYVEVPAVFEREARK